MKNHLNEMLESEIEQLERNPLYHTLSEYERGYLDGEHDHCISLLDSLHIKHHYKFYGKGYDD